jgi:threonine aldolase
MVADVLQERDWIIRLLPVETNIVIFELAPHVTPVALMTYLESQGFKVSSMGAQLIRFVFHLDQSIEDVERLCEVLLAFKSHQSH